MIFFQRSQAGNLPVYNICKNSYPRAYAMMRFENGEEFSACYVTRPEGLPLNFEVILETHLFSKTIWEF